MRPPSSTTPTTAAAASSAGTANLRASTRRFSAGSAGSGTVISEASMTESGAGPNDLFSLYDARARLDVTSAAHFAILRCSLGPARASKFIGSLEDGMTLVLVAAGTLLAACVQ